MTSRIRIDAPTGVIEVEGEQEFVETQLDKLLPLIEACGFGTRLTPQAAPTPAGENGPGDQEPKSDPAENDAQTKNRPAAKRSLRGAVRAPKGQSCADRILALRNEGYFREQRSNTDIVEELGKKGWTYKSNQVAAATGPMFKRGDLQRTKAGKGWTYYWDRD